jgi:hypothetical protein
MTWFLTKARRALKICGSLETWHLNSSDDYGCRALHDPRGLCSNASSLAEKSHANGADQNPPHENRDPAIVPQSILVSAAVTRADN